MDGHSMSHNRSDLPEVPAAILRNQVIYLHSSPFHADVLCGIYLHALATILVTRVNAFYTCYGATEHDLNIVRIPRDAATGDDATRHCTIWTNTTNSNRVAWWELVLFDSIY